MGGAREGRVDDYILFSHFSNDDPVRMEETEEGVCTGPLDNIKD